MRLPSRVASFCLRVYTRGQQPPVTYVIDEHEHDGLGNDVTLRLVHDSYVRVDQVTNRLHLSLERRVRWHVLAVSIALWWVTQKAVTSQPNTCPLCVLF